MGQKNKALKNSNGLVEPFQDPIRKQTPTNFMDKNVKQDPK